jgi:UDP-glucose 4-epimerase
MTHTRIAPDVKLGRDVTIVDFVNLYGCEIGDETKIGTFVEIQRGVKVGARVKISSHTFICEGVEIEDFVFVGHGVMFINDRFPRAVTPTGELKGRDDWTEERTLVRKGASIGSNVTILCGITIGEGAIVGAGSVVTKDVPVTGGAGFIGSHLVDALAARGDDVIVVDNLSVGSRDNLTQHAAGPVRLEVVDVLDKPAFVALMRGVDTVFHLATQCVRLSLSEPELVHRVNTDGTLNALVGAAEAGVRRFVYVSSSEAFGSAATVPMSEDHPFAPTTIYGASKLAGEHYARVFHGTHGLAAVIVRPFNTYGPRSHFEGAYGEVIPKFVVRVLNGRRPLVFGDGQQTRDFTCVTDTVRGIVLASECDALIGRSVNVARGQEVSINEIARLVLDACGRNDLAPEHGPDRPADVRRHYADVTRARAAMGFEPAVEIRTGIARYVEWFRATYPDPSRLLAQEQAINWQAPVRLET